MSYEPRVQTPLSPKPYFDDTNPQYRFCCCHVRIWTMVLAVIELVGVFLGLAGAITDYVRYRQGYPSASDASPAGSLAWGIISFVFWIIVLGLLIYGLKKERPNFLIPHLIMQAISIIACVVSAVVYFVVAGMAGTTAPSSKGGKAVKKVALGASIGGGVLLLVCALVLVLFMYIVYKCYRYLKEKNLAKEASSYVPMGTSYSAIEKRI